jgi:hypothetical protein
VGENRAVRDELNRWLWSGRSRTSC